VLEIFTAQLRRAQNLTHQEVDQAIEWLVDETVSVDAKAAFLTALAQKGETVEEIAAFARALGAKAIRPKVNHSWQSGELLDVVGTGGDRLSTFNISTTVALLAAAAGVQVAKHGNRASTSTIGSADVMEALGLPFELGPTEAATALEKHGFVFFFAPKYHPAFKHIIPARKRCAEKGQRTVFNFLGPLLNPAAPTAMLVGVPRPELCECLARVLQLLGVRRAMVVCGEVPEANGVRYLDEFSTLGPTTVAEFYQERALTCSKLSIEGFPVSSATLDDLRGGDRKENATIVRNILNGKERGPKRDAVLLNAAAALFVAGVVPNLSAGWRAAAEVIDSGRASRKLGELSQVKQSN
jgi:anthranilate phosphoribosyltransferase